MQVAENEVRDELRTEVREVQATLHVDGREPRQVRVELPVDVAERVGAEDVE